MEEVEQGKPTAGGLTYEIFSILESKFLFGCGHVVPHLPFSSSPQQAPATQGKVCVLSIDGGARPVDGLFAAAALVRLEAALRRRSGGSKDARLAHFFDVAAGSGAGGVLAAMLFARGPRGRPMYSAQDALGFLLRRIRRGWSGGLVRCRAGVFEKVFGELTLRDTVRPVLVPCYDLATRAPFLFSRAAAANSPAHDFLLRDVWAATCAAAMEVASVDGATRIAAVGGEGVALRNPTAAAITHVLNNRREFPSAAAVDDLLVMSIGTGDAAAERKAIIGRFARIAAEGVSDMVDQAVAMAFGQSRTSNYVRIQGTGSGGGRAPRTACGGETKQQAEWKAEAMLLQKSVESVLFQGRRLAGETNAEKLERVASELATEHGRRKQQQQSAASPGAGLQLVPVPRPPSAIKQRPAAPQTNATAASASAVIAATMEADAAAKAPPPQRRRRTQVRAAVVATKRAPVTSSSCGARRITL